MSKGFVYLAVIMDGYSRKILSWRLSISMGSSFCVDALEQAALDAMTPGTTAEEVEAAWRRVVSRHGITKESRIGYSTGLNYPPDWGEHTISLRPGDRTLLQENMTLHCVPAIAMEGWAIEISECVRVTPKGGKPLCDFPQKLFVRR